MYAPNWDDESFFKQILSMLPDLSSCDLILGGDFNCWMNPSLDRSSPTSATQSKSAKVIQAFMDEFNVIDPWRFLIQIKGNILFSLIFTIPIHELTCSL